MIVDEMSDEEVRVRQLEEWDPAKFPDSKGRWADSMRTVCESIRELSVSEYRSILRTREEHQWQG